jgi:hypothetical protein
MAMPVIIQEIINARSGKADASRCLKEKAVGLSYLRMHQSKRIRVKLSNKPDPYQKQEKFVTDFQGSGWNRCNNGYMR